MGYAATLTAPLVDSVLGYAIERPIQTHVYEKYTKNWSERNSSLAITAITSVINIVVMVIIYAIFFKLHPFDLKIWKQVLLQTLGIIIFTPLYTYVFMKVFKDIYKMESKARIQLYVTMNYVLAYLGKVVIAMVVIRDTPKDDKDDKHKKKKKNKKKD